MKYLDIAVAVLVGTGAITGLVGWSPAAGDSMTLRYHMRTALRDQALAFVEETGMAWFGQATATQLCSAASAASNSTFHLTASVGGSACASAPSRGAVVAELSFDVGPNEVTLSAWSGAAD